jgi:predicted kinase
MSECICTVMVGLPGLGKSTIVEEMYKPDTWIYSTDRFIEDAARHFGTTYNEAFADNIKAATSAMNQQLSDAIKEHKDIIWDQTNLGKSKRAKIVNRMRDAGYRACCVCLLPPEAHHLDDQKAWKRRLDGREGKTIPTHVLANMLESFEVPTLDEGFDSIKYYSMYGVEIDFALVD